MLNKFDILTEKLIKAGKSHNLLRIPAFIAIMMVVLAEGVYEIGRKVSRFLFKRKFLSRALSLAVAWLMFAPFYQPAVIYAMEETSVSEPSPEETVAEETTVSETTPEETTSSESTSESTTPSSDISSETTTTYSDNTNPDITTLPDEIPDETDETSVTPSETEMPEETSLPLMMSSGPAETVYISDADDLFYFFNNRDPDGNSTDDEGNPIDNSEKDVILTNDIDCSGRGALPVMSTYNGTFDGQGYVIKNLTLGKTPRNPEADRVSAMFINFGGQMMNVGFINVTADYSDMSSANAAIVARRAVGGAAISNCFIINSSISGKTNARTGYFIAGSFTATSCYAGGTISSEHGVSNTNGVTRISSVAGCTDEVLQELNNAREDGGMQWYKDTAPEYSNYGYPSMKPTIPVEFYKTASTRFTGNEVTFGEGKANADTYAVIGAGNTILLPDNKPEPLGKNFVGWSFDPDTDPDENPDDIIVGTTSDPYDITGSVPYTIKSSDIQDGVIKVYAVWNFTPTYKLSFLDKDGNPIDLDTNPDDDVTKFETDEMNTGKTYKEAFGEDTFPVSNTADAGYESDGWYRNDTDEKWEIDSSTVTKREFLDEFPDGTDPWVIELKEKFIPIEYTITLDANGGEVEGDNPIIYTIEDSDVTLPEPTRTGYEFKGWKVTASDFTDIVPVGDDIVTTIPHDALSNITVKAQWEAITYTVEYDINADTYIVGSSDVITSDHVYDVSSALSENPFKRNYYTFEGWATSSDGAKVYNDKQAVMNLTDIKNGVVTLYAVWKPIEYTITYENSANGSYPEIDGATMTYTSIANGNRTTYTVESRTINLEDITCAGYDFKGFKYNGGTVMNNSISLPDNPLPENITIVGAWEPVPYTVSYDTNDGFWNGGFDLTDFTSFDITKSLTLPNQNNIYRDYYKFSGWEISGDCNKSGTTVAVLPAGTYGNATATAVWTPINYTLTTNLNGGRLPDGVNIPSTYNNTTLLTLPIPSKTGYTFDGWTVVVDSGYADNGNFPTGYVTKIENNFGNATLTANFTINQYTISFDTMGGTEIADITDDYGTAVSAPENPEKEGYDFIGWYEDEECTTPYSFTTIPAEDITVYAGWEIRKFDVIFANADVAAINDVPYGSTIERPENPTKDPDGDIYYRFLGWFSDAGCTTAFDFSSPIKADTTVYAKWLSYENIPETYNVSYKVDADSETNISIGDFVEGEQVVIPSVPDDGVNHKVFVGFNIEGDTSETPAVYNAGDVFTVGTENVVFIVIWDVEKHTVTFDSNGGTEIAPIEVDYNKTVTEPSAEKRGFILKGWFTEDGTEFSFDTPITEDIVLKAEWEAITIPETPSRPGSSGSSGVKYEKTIRITATPDGITAPAELFKASADMDDFRSSVDVRITNASETAEDELIKLLRLHTEIPDEDIFIFDISLYERGTDRKITLPKDTMVSLTIPVCDKFTSDLEKVRVVSVHDGKLVVYPEPYISSSGKHLLVNFSSDKFSTFAFVLDKNNEIADLSAAAPSAIAAEMMLFAPIAMTPPVSEIIVDGKTRLRISRKRKVYKVVNKFH